MNDSACIAFITSTSVSFRRAATLTIPLATVQANYRGLGEETTEGVVFVIFRLQFHKHELDTGQRPGIMLSNPVWPQLSPCSQSVSSLEALLVTENLLGLGMGQALPCMISFDFTVGTAM